MLPQQYCLRWKYHHSNLQTMFSSLLERQAFCDVILACEGRTLRAHKMVLSACSSYFDALLSTYHDKDPILIMNNVKFDDMEALLSFMYRGEINVEHCQLASLLKTAEELRIKGLAEVSWRDDEASNSPPPSDASLPSISSSLVASSQESKDVASPDKGEAPSVVEPVVKRKRGRPMLEDYDALIPTSTAGAPTSSRTPTPPLAVVHAAAPTPSYQSNQNNVTNQTNPTVPKIFVKNLEKEKNCDSNERSSPSRSRDTLKASESEPDDIECDPDLSTELDQNDHHYLNISIGGVQYAKSETGEYISDAEMGGATHVKGESNMAAIEAQFPDVIKMNDYLNTGRRPQFWEEPFTRRVMDAIKNKELEMKSAAELLGVSYGTLYGRYRDAYGCLKHPYRMRDFWTDTAPTEIIGKIQRKELSIYRAAEQLNVTPATLNNYLISLSSGADASQSAALNTALLYPQQDDASDSGGDDGGAASFNAVHAVQALHGISVVKKAEKRKLDVSDMATVTPLLATSLQSDT